MASAKTRVIEMLFADPSRWDGERLTRPVATLPEVAAAIGQANREAGATDARLSDRNPANFFKDFVRNVASANRNWPAAVLRAGYTGRQRTGAGDCFEFVAVPTGQAVAFVEAARPYPRLPASTRFAVAQSLSLPLMQRMLARRDENWLQKVAVDLHLIQQHFALHHADGRWPTLREVSFMQSNLKQSASEIDGLFFGQGDGSQWLLITNEAKGARDDILENQIRQQVAAAQAMPDIRRALRAMRADPAATQVVPLATKEVGVGALSGVPDAPASVHATLLYVAEYELVGLNAAVPASLSLARETLLAVSPPLRLT